MPAHHADGVLADDARAAHERVALEQQLVDWVGLEVRVRVGELGLGLGCSDQGQGWGVGSGSGRARVTG